MVVGESSIAMLMRESIYYHSGGANMNGKPAGQPSPSGALLLIGRACCVAERHGESCSLSRYPIQETYF